MKGDQAISSGACWQVPQAKVEDEVDEAPKPEDIYLREYLVTFRITSSETKVS